LGFETGRLVALVLPCALFWPSGVGVPSEPQHGASTAFGPISLDWSAAFTPWLASGRPHAAQVFIVTNALDPPEWDESGIQFLPPNLNQELQSPESSRNDRAASVL
jgi:hypothetical protein